MKIKTEKISHLMLLLLFVLSSAACNKDKDADTCPDDLFLGDIELDEHILKLDRYKGIKKITFIDFASRLATFELVNENEIGKREFEHDQKISCENSSKKASYTYYTNSREYRFVSEEYGELKITYTSSLWDEWQGGYDSDKSPIFGYDLRIDYYAFALNGLIRYNYSKSENISYSEKNRSGVLTHFWPTREIGGREFNDCITLSRFTLDGEDEQKLYFNEEMGLLNFYDDNDVEWVIHSLE